MATLADSAGSGKISVGHRKVIFASSLGTVFEWYDFYLYGSLATVIGATFFSGFNETTRFIFALLAFAAGFAVRPFGALLFGRLGDLVGRKYTFLITIVIMGLSTFFVGLLPSYATIGIAAPIILISLRLLQGLALGGEYGGAATYVAEHAPMGKRGLYTSWIQTTATLGFLLSLVVLLICRNSLTKEEFADWGWRIPFLLSLLLLFVSVYIRLQLQESPLFQQMKAEGKGSKSPIAESFTNWSNGKIVLLALLGATAGQAVVWYGGQFYVRFFMLQSIKMDVDMTDKLVALSLLLATPFFIFFGWLSDRIGRKPIVMAGCLIAALTYFPIFKALTHYANPALETAAATNPVTVIADPSTCSVQFDPIGGKKFTSSCDIAKAQIARAGVSYSNEAAPAGSVAQVKFGTQLVSAFEGTGLEAAAFKSSSDAFNKQIADSLKAAGYPAKADIAQIGPGIFQLTGAGYMVLLLLTLLVIYVTMVYGPIAAWLVELFPTRIRYTSMSLPYHIGNGWFGGFLPATAFAMVAANGNQYFGLWYPVGVAVFTFIVGSLFLRETKDVDISK
jgi:Sugar (and other) transporter